MVKRDSLVFRCLNFLFWCVIKLEREKAVPKVEEKIHKRREKKEKKKEKKERDGKKLKKLDYALSGCKDDQLEKSDLTEEHEPPVCYISDGSHNSNKRKRETLSSSECRVDGNIIKIRFSLKKSRKPDESPSKEPVCSTSGRADTSTPPKAQEQCHPWSEKTNTSSLVPAQEPWCHDELREQISSSSGTFVYDNEMQKAALQYKTLIEDWMPLPLQVLQNDDEGDDWLFMKKQKAKPIAKMSEVHSDVTCASSTSFPRAHFLPEAQIYALPYVVPF
ncbi:hypothetical protein DITRI_Ditri03aG0217800 [Diplodiscus trichospermus]